MLMVKLIKKYYHGHRVLAREMSTPVLCTPYFNFGHPQIWDVIIGRIGIGHPIFIKNGILDTALKKPPISITMDGR